MGKIYGAQRKLGYHDIVYNIKSGKFFVPLPGDNYYELDVQTGGGTGGGGGTQNTATLPLANPTRLGRADSSGLKTQSDFNKYIDAYVKEVEGTNLPGGAVGINEVLAEGDTANPGQSLHFKVNEGDIPPIKRDSIDIEGGSGLRLGGLVSYYTIREPFTLDTENGPTQEFAYSVRRISAVDDYFEAEHPKGGNVSTSIGLTGIQYASDRSSFDLDDGRFYARVGDYENPIFKIEVSNYDNESSVTAGEFIGDGSKLTNLPRTTIDQLPSLPS